MGTQAYQLAGTRSYRLEEIILEVGVERDVTDGVVGSTTFLSRVGPTVHTVDVDPGQVARAREIPNVVPYLGLAEEVLADAVDWLPPIGFAWLDGHDWPYAHAPAGMWDDQKREYLARSQNYSRTASRESHLKIVELIAELVVPSGMIVLDDTWALPSVLDPTTGPDAWNGKGGAAVPYLLENGFIVRDYGDIHFGHVVLVKT